MSSSRSSFLSSLRMPAVESYRCVAYLRLRWRQCRKQSKSTSIERPPKRRLGPHPRGARPRARVHRARRGRALRPAGGGVGADRRAGPHAGASSRASRSRSTCGWPGSRAARSGRRHRHRGARTWSRSCGSRAGWSSTSPPPTATTRTTRCARPSTWRSRACTTRPPRRARRSTASGSGMAQAMAERALRSAVGRDALHLRLAKYVAQAARPPLRRQAYPVHRRADRRDAERQRHGQLGRERALDSTDGAP